MLYSSAAGLLNEVGPLSFDSAPKVRRVLAAGSRPCPTNPWSELAQPCAVVGQRAEEWFQEWPESVLTTKGVLPGPPSA